MRGSVGFIIEDLESFIKGFIKEKDQQGWPPQWATIAGKWPLLTFLCYSRSRAGCQCAIKKKNRRKIKEKRRRAVFLIWTTGEGVAPDQPYDKPPVT